MITVQEVTIHFQSAPRQSADIDTKLTLTPSVISSSNYVIMVTETI
jgi:hypothetical protein